MLRDGLGYGAVLPIVVGVVDVVPDEHAGERPTLNGAASNPLDYEEYGYDANDNPTTKRTRSGGVFTTHFDALNRITAIDAPVGSNDVWYGYEVLSAQTDCGLREAAVASPDGQIDQPLSLV